MGKKDNFTAGRIAAYKCEEGKKQSIYWDAKTPSLGVRVTTSGAKSFIFETRLDNKTIRITIGDVKTWAIDKAQAEARRLKAMTDQGEDPRIVKAEKLAAAEEKRAKVIHASIPALEIWQAYIEARTPRWSERHKADHENMSQEGGKSRTRGRRKGDSDKTQPGILLPILAQPLNKIDADCVTQWLQVESKNRPTQARLAFHLLRAFLNWAAATKEYQPLVNANACGSRIEREELPKKAAKSDCLQREQLPRWFEVVRTINNPVIATYLQTVLLTGARREEIAGLKWEDVDFQWKCMTIRDKVEGERTIPLTPYVSSLLASLPHLNEWVFSSPKADSGRLQDPSIQHRKMCALAGIESLTLHGLRRSFGTLAEWVECPTGVSAQIMGHKPSATAEKHYRVRPLDLLRMWHTKIEGWILTQAGIEQPAEDAKLGLKVVTS